MTDADKVREALEAIARLEPERGYNGARRIATAALAALDGAVVLTAADAETVREDAEYVASLVRLGAIRDYREDVLTLCRKTLALLGGKASE